MKNKIKNKIELKNKTFFFHSSFDLKHFILKFLCKSQLQVKLKINKF